MATLEVLDIRIKSREEADAEFLAVVNAVKAGKKVTPTIGSYFTSLEAVRALLTERRLALLRLIREHKPKSINALAKIAGRNFKNVHADVMLLNRHGLIRVGATSKAGRSMAVPYKDICIHAPI